MAMEKNIFWVQGQEAREDGRQRAIVHILQGYCPVTLKEYRRLIALLQETFPQATEEDKLELSKVITSDRVKGFTLLQWTGWIDRGEHEGWHQTEGTVIPYGFT